MEPKAEDAPGAPAPSEQEMGKQPATAATGALMTEGASSTPIGEGGGRDYAPQPSIEEDVKQLVGSVSSWWSGFSKRSQEQINQARAQIDAQGGIMSIAKREAQKFEAQLTEAQKHARDDVVQRSDKERMDRTALGVDGLAAAGTYTPPVIDVKGKGRSIEGDDGAAVDRLEERLEEQRRARQSSEGDASETGSQAAGAGNPLFDADALSGIIDQKAVDEAVHAAKQNAQNAVESVQSFWTKIQADPRLSSVQASVAQTLQSVKISGVQAASEDASSEGKEGQSEKGTSTTLLPDLSKQLQGAFPHLDWKQSQDMAKRYFETASATAQTWSKEMDQLVSDLVKVVPPDEEQGGASKTGASASAEPKGPVLSAVPAARAARSPFESKHTAIAAEADDDDFFDWDNEVEPRAASEKPGVAEAATAPSSTTDSSLVDVKMSAPVPTNPAEAASTGPSGTSAESAVTTAPANAKVVSRMELANDDDDDDSDWE